jgi:murein DD-endopeptidase MepM/ murein hydrolase activator NlpD
MRFKIRKNASFAKALAMAAGAGGFSLVLAFSFFTPVTVAADVDAIQEMIAGKIAELQSIGSKIQETQSKLVEVGTQKKTLNSAIAQLNYGIEQINLGIKSRQVNIEKLELEMQLIDDRQGRIQESVASKKKAVGSTMRQLQRIAGRGSLQIFLSNSTLSEAVSELWNTNSLQTGLISSISELNKLSDQLEQTLTEASEKRQAIQAEKKNLQNSMAIAVQEKNAKADVLMVAKNRESVYQKQLTLLQEQQDSIASQINRMEQELKLALVPGQVPPAAKGLLSWPVIFSSGGNGKLTQAYGNIDHSLYGNHPHNGMDIGTPIGTPIYAAADGVVIRVDRNDVSSWKKYQYGTYVLIDHQNGLSTLYAHLAKYLVSAGDKVSRGEVIAYSDNTGYSTGSHLHFGLYLTPVGGWKQTTSAPGLLRVPPASGLVPVAATLDPAVYLQ